MLEVKLIPLSGVEEIEVPGPVFCIGRDDGCDYQVYNMQVSRRHCDIVVDETGVRIRDRNSRNGTFVENERIEGERPLHDSETLAVGPVLFTVSIRPGKKTGLFKRIRRNARTLVKSR